MIKNVRAPSAKKARHVPSRRWSLRDAKTRFTELVRRARSEGPQHVDARGRDEVAVVAAEEFHRLEGDRSGAALVAALQASPYRDIDIEA
jgi:prevent-host-death family protein